MTNKFDDIEVHQFLARLMTSYEIISIIKDLKSEKDQLTPFFTQKEIEKYDILIDVYAKQLYNTYPLTNQNYSYLIH